MTAISAPELDAVTATSEQTDPTFGQILGQFFGFVPGTHIAEKKPRGRPLKVQPPPPPGIVKNTISDEESDELWVDPHDVRLLKMEFRQLTIEDGIDETVAIDDLAKVYGLSYKAVFKVVNES
jgi:hypothetical protein